jgi:ribosome-binding factor A
VSHGLVSITEVQVAPDLRTAVVYISHLGDESERDEVLAGLQRAAHFLHGALMHRTKMRNTPELTFKFDPSIERGARLTTLIAEVAARSDGDQA